MIESLECRRLMDATLPVNPGSPQSNNSGNYVAEMVSQHTGDGAVISQAAQSGSWPQAVQLLLAFGGRGRYA